MADYYLDGKAVRFTALIDFAKKHYGYQTDGFYCTSEAARILRENGHEVSDRPPTEGVGQEAPHV